MKNDCSPRQITSLSFTYLFHGSTLTLKGFVYYIQDGQSGKEANDQYLNQDRTLDACGVADEDPQLIFFDGYAYTLLS